MIITKEDLKRNQGEDVSKEILENIKSNMRLSNHAIEKLNERSGSIVSYFKEDVINYKQTINNINKQIDKSILAYYNTDGSINIAINRWEYFVFDYNENTNKWVLVTFKEKSLNSVDIFEKRQLAKDGYDRKY